MVLLCSHYERYLRSVIEETVAAINTADVPGTSLTTELRLRHSFVAAERLVEREWTKRQERLAAFIASEAWLWGGSPKADLTAKSLLSWMKAPAPNNVVKLYRLWGIPDIFTRITRFDHTRRTLWLDLQSLVDKRNNIAHGDFAAEATRGDVERYRDTVARFCDRADRALAQKIRVQLGLLLGW